MASIPDYLRHYIAAHSTLSLATADGARPWAASVLYATDAPLNFYFISDPGTRHCLDLAGDGQVAATISDDCADWNKIAGVQLSGTAGPVPAAERSQVEKLYLGKFQAVRQLLQAPGSDQEKRIAERLGEAQFYRIMPQWLRYIDNSRAFGHKEEFQFPLPRGDNIDSS
jgi:hypothetical protein